MDASKLDEPGQTARPGWSYWIRRWSCVWQRLAAPSKSWESFRKKIAANSAKSHVDNKYVTMVKPLYHWYISDIAGDLKLWGKFQKHTCSTERFNSLAITRQSLKGILPSSLMFIIRFCNSSLCSVVITLRELHERGWETCMKQGMTLSVIS